MDRPILPSCVLAWFPGQWPVRHDRQTQHRCRYLLIGALDYIAALTVLVCYAAAGFTDWLPIWVIVAGATAQNVLFLGAAAAGWTQRLPSSLIPTLQIGLGLAWTVAGVFLVPEIALLFLMPSLFILACYASSSLRRVHFLWTWAVISAVTSMVLYMQFEHIHFPLNDAQDWAVFIATLPIQLARIFLMNAELSHARHILHESNKALKSTQVKLDEARKFLDDLVDHLPVALFVFKPTGEVEIVNRQAAQLLSGEETSETPLDLVSVAEKFSGLRISSPFQTNIAETEVTAINGRRHVARLSPFGTGLDNKGSILTLSDMSAIRAAEIQREEALHFLSHDMRAPLSAAIALLSAPTQDEQSQRGRVLTNLRHSLSLADDFVMLARAARLTSSTFRQLDLSEVVSEAADLLEPAAAERQVALDVQLDNAHAPLVSGDWSLLLRAVSNLIANAISASSTGGEVEVRVGCSPDEVTLTVRDRGPGFPEDLLAQLFTSRHHSKTVGSRAGLGLLLVHQVACNHGGTIKARNRHTGGARIDLRFNRMAPA